MLSAKYKILDIIYDIFYCALYLYTNILYGYVLRILLGKKIFSCGLPADRKPEVVRRLGPPLSTYGRIATGGIEQKSRWECNR